MTIRVISQNTAERNAETRRLFLECKPYLDKGHSLTKATQIVLGVNHQSYTQRHWYKELRKYAESLGYEGRV
ncbi:MAG: hypothetical protein IKE95_02035 [Methanobrevibacter sp.]|nr:hypothetical protein [Methanobrevibacter sp.]